MTKNHGTWKRTIEYCKEMIYDNVTICVVFFVKSHDGT